MTEIVSSVFISQSQSVVFTYLQDLNNHQALMPENVYNWSSTLDEARFTIQNMAKLALKVSERVPNDKVLIIPAEEPPFELSLQWNLSQENNQTKAELLISADLNMMMKMLASGPLQKLADHQTEKLGELLS